MTKDCSDEKGNEILFWLDDRNLQDIPTSSYWNDEEEERKKDYYLCGTDGQRLMTYLKERTTYYREYESIVTFVNDAGLQFRGIGVDLAAGVCWTTALLSRIEALERIYAVDISKHRILKIASNVFKLFKADTNKITRVIGSFYDIKLPDNSVDFCFMGQAFHHADSPARLLSEIHRILKPEGFIVIMGERPILPAAFLKQYLKNVVKILIPIVKYQGRPVYKLMPGIPDLFPPDTRLGDYRYGLGDYHAIFKANGFLLRENRQKGFITFVAAKLNEKTRQNRGLK